MKTHIWAVTNAHKHWKILKNPRERETKKEREREVPDSPGNQAS